MDKQQQVFWTDINLCHKNKCPPQKKTINTNGIICLRQNSKIPFQNSSHSTWWTTKKNGKKNLKLVFHLSVSPTTIHVVKLIPCREQWWTKTNEKWRLSCHLTTDNSNLAKHPLQNSGYDETYVISFVLTRQIQKVSKWH